MLEEEEEIQTKTLNASILWIDFTTKRSQQWATDGSFQPRGNIESQLNSSKGGGSPLGNEVRKKLIF